MKTKIKKSLIEREFLTCPYCFKTLTLELNNCCKEVGHQVEAIETVHGEVYLKAEVEAIND